MIKDAYVVFLGVTLKVVMFTNICRNYDSVQVVVADTFNHRRQRQDFFEFEASLVYKRRDPVSKNQRGKKKKL